MKKNKKNRKKPAKHGIISVIQTPDKGENNAADTTKSGTENESGGSENHGIISIVQAPHREGTEPKK
jgi:hypothetical protein